MEKESIKRLNPYFSIWFNTRNTVNAVLDGRTTFRYWIPLLAVLIISSLGISNDGLGTITVIGITLLIVVSEAVVMYILIALLIAVGKIWNGKSDMKQMAKIMGLVSIPYLLIGIVQLVQLIFSGYLIPSDEVNYGLQLIVWLICFRVLIIGIARSQQFTFGIALLNVAMVYLVLFVFAWFYQAMRS